MFSFFVCPVLVKFLPLFGDHRLGKEAGDSDVSARGRKLLDTAVTAGSYQDFKMSKNLTKSSDNN